MSSDRNNGNAGYMLRHDIQGNEIVVVPFSLNIRHWGEGPFYDGYDIYYFIDLSLGLQCVESRISQSRMNLEALRDSIEQYLCDRESELDICMVSDTTETTLHLTRIRCSDLPADKNKKMQHEDYIVLATVNTIKTDPNSERPIIKDIHEGDSCFGGLGIGSLRMVKRNDKGENECTVSRFCDERNVIKEIYEAFLDSCLYMDKFYKEDDMKYDTIHSYNKFKSHLIESYIIGETDLDLSSTKDRIQICHFFRINPDWDGCIWTEDWFSFERTYNDTVKIFIYGQNEEENMKFRTHLTGLQKWLKDFMVATNEASTFIDETKFDVVTWNKRGLEIAAELRRQLPPYIDLWYRYPYEDRSHSGCRPLLIYNK